MERTIIIGTRGSDLALWQANYTKKLLEENGHVAELKIISTVGDASQKWETAFDKLDGKGFFTKELEEALLNKSIDLAVHSHKDLPTESPEGLMIAAVSKREDPSDMLIIKDAAAEDKLKFGLKKNAVVGTSSARRKSQLLAFRPDLEVKDLRGNVPTRINKLRDSAYDAILIATAGVERLELELDEFTVQKLNPEEFVPAPAQGVLAWQTREDDTELMEVLDEINDLDVMIKINIERRLLALFDGGCHLPFGCYCDTETDDEDRLRFKVWVSVAETWDAQPQQFYFDTLDTDDFTEQMFDHIKALTAKKVFVTKTFKEDDYLPRALGKLGFTVEGESLIEFKEIKIRFLPRTEWIFFSSKHAVRYFFKQNPKVEKTIKFGCVGSSTAAELRAHGHRANFIGQSTDIKLVGKQFSSIVGSHSVLFPIARGSMQSIQWQMVKRDSVINLEVYATLNRSREVNPDFDVVIFTSPSNVESYFEKNTWSPKQKAIAMGEATGKALEKLKIKKYTMPKSFDDLGLLHAVLGLSYKQAKEESN